MQEVVGIDVAYVTERRPTLGILGLGGLLRIVVVGERPAVGEIDRAGLAARQLVAGLIADLDRAEHGAADRALVREPVGGVAHGEAVALGTAVVFPHDRSPPFDHLLLGRDRAGRGGM